MTNPNREETLQGLRDALRFLEQHPDVPISPYVFIRYEVDDVLRLDGRTTGAERRAEIDRVATIVGEEPNGRGYTVRKAFTGGVVYRASSVEPAGVSS